MITNLGFGRVLLFAGAVLLIIVALTMVVGVIPLVKADKFPAATPERAATGFWINAVINCLMAVVLIVTALRIKGRSLSICVLLGLIAALTALMGLALIDAASAFMSHGPAMKIVPMLLIPSLVLDFLAAVGIIAAIFLFPKKQ